MKGKILLPLDASEASAKAFLPAKSLAELLNMTLHILHISDEKLSEEELINKLQIDIEGLKCFVVDQKEGNPEKIITEEAKSCEYIVMGTHGKTCNKEATMGSTAVTVLESTSIPILLINPNTKLKLEDGKWIPRKALIPLNGTPGTAEALSPVTDILSKTSSKIDILHIYGEKKEYTPKEGEFSAPYYEDYPQHEWPTWSKEFLKRFCPSVINSVKINVNLSKGDPAEKILNFAKENENDFIAVVWHGTLSHLRAQVLKRLLYESTCPLMLIKLG